jgi:hypothetical protein
MLWERSSPFNTVRRFVMPASSSRGQNTCRFWLSRFVAVFAVLALSAVVGVSTPGCSPAVPPTPAAKPVAVHHEHDEHAREEHAQKASDGSAEHADHDHGDHEHAHPETLAAGVAELETMWGHVKGALKTGDREKADEHVHEVGHLLEDFEGLLSKVEPSLQESGKQAAKVVFECFDALDVALHGSEEELKKLDVDDLGTRLEAAVESLKTIGAGGSK